MFTQQEYMWAWGAYLLGAAVCLGVFWVMTRKIPWSELRNGLRIMAAVFMLVPWYSDATGGYLAPAWIASVLEVLFDGPEAFWRAGTPLIIALVAVLLISTSVHLFLWFRNRQAENLSPM